MSWLRATVSIVIKEIKDSAGRIVGYIMASVRSAFKRWYIVPVAIGVAAGIGVTSPVVAGSLVAIMVNDQDAHPAIRLFFDTLAVAAAISLCLWQPAAAIVVSIIPIADLINRWLDEIRAEKEALDARERAVVSSHREGHVQVCAVADKAAR